ncbi:MAG TPA: hypothetical protein VMT85_05720 [Thermoanaerobaculia bacterium]|nr:hypothetical protein [Thermoanaerobaculia bacterium]
MSPRRASSSGQSGFTLIETLVGLAITAEILLIALVLFDVNGRISRNQTQVADLQQSQRIAHNDVIRLARMAGRGGLPQIHSVAVADNVADTDTVGGNAPVADTDVLTIRGVLSSPVYQVDTDDASAFVAPDAGNPGTIKIRSVSQGIAQSLEAIEELSGNGNNVTPDGLMLVSAASDAIFAVVQITGISIADIADLDGDGIDDQEATITFSGDPSTTPNSASFLQLSSTPGSYPGSMQTVSFAGLVEEYRFYVRDVTTAAGGYAPKLSRARFYPNTDTVYPGGGNDKIDIAENVLDFQVSQARDTDDDDVIAENEDRAEDEWWGNDPGDDDTDFALTDPLFNLEVTTLVRTGRPDRGFLAEPIEEIANRVYNEPAFPSSAQDRIDRSHRRHILRSVVDFRNLN